MRMRTPVPHANKAMISGVLATFLAAMMFVLVVPRGRTVCAQQRL